MWLTCFKSFSSLACVKLGKRQPANLKWIRKARNSEKQWWWWTPGEKRWETADWSSIPVLPAANSWSTLPPPPSSPVCPTADTFVREFEDADLLDWVGQDFIYGEHSSSSTNTQTRTSKKIWFTVNSSCTRQWPNKVQYFISYFIYELLEKLNRNGFLTGL